MLLQPHSSHPFCSTHTTLTPTLGDGTVRVWDTETLECLYIIHPCSDVGDIFVVVYSAERETMYIGCQNTSIQWHNLSKPPTTPTTARFPPISPRYASSASSHFFDGYPADVSRAGTEDDDEEPARETRFVADGDVYMSAHDGYVYALLLGRDLPNDNGDILISGSGDGDVKLWTITDDASIRLLRTLPGNPDKGILTLALLDDEYLFCGMQGGDIKIWDLETDDVLALTIKNHQIFSGSADGTIRRWNRSFEYTEVWQEHEGIVLSMTTSRHYLMTGASDRLIKFWDIPTTPAQPSVDHQGNASDVLVYALEKWIAMRTISGQPKYLDECRRGAKFLKNVLKQLGAESVMVRASHSFAVSRMFHLPDDVSSLCKIPGASGRNPLVFGKFTANASTKRVDRAPNVLVYGHYDVISADVEDWSTDPFELVGR
ncbi:hypothetical protein BC936DRAFT_149478 [Jimgerdemannia flammicorona]|uniref:Uncharacterized protein n=1 Tax=Jimgerdemannia flammicorona TaxID=994334 RepID=A0A433D0Q4_9FUNG|nr:hypothetical protein BC936DRAFT_149478 [Jimgerdemannia flammicorona]